MTVAYVFECKEKGTNDSEMLVPERFSSYEPASYNIGGKLQTPCASISFYLFCTRLLYCLLKKQILTLSFTAYKKLIDIW